jgi:CheY-like chemotaxis protein
MKHVYCLLIAEDDDNDVFFLQHAFKEANVQNPLQIVHDGQETVDYLAGVGKFSDRTKFPLPYLLILDLKMPRMTGLEVLQWLQDQPELRCLPVIVLSSSAHRLDIERAYDLGANAFVVKPSAVGTRTDLAKLIKGFWLNLNEAPAVATDGLEGARKLRQEF